ncbi:hypothetical protein [Lignipirellula cremea]|uniref:Uncharacterized protein n=1 Tax=Lignipirellula cremea TaxID=2528010 RepID=A0A518DN69_9BACT|nr:hypothetical protein [Lignipirellula cremea]QDU93284.1 hypothetical protein Pla8534_10640 [Lignipirellula cremea]
MRYLLLAVAFACLGGASEASAQIVVGRPVVAYYAPTVAVPVYQAPAYYAPVAAYPVARAAYYAPPVVAYPAATTAYYAPTTAYYAPTAAYYAPTAVVVGRPAWLGANAYGGLQPYVAGQPIRNTFRYLTP